MPPTPYIFHSPFISFALLSQTCCCISVINNNTECHHLLLYLQTNSTHPPFHTKNPYKHREEVDQFQVQDFTYFFMNFFFISQKPSSKLKELLDLWERRLLLPTLHEPRLSRSYLRIKGSYKAVLFGLVAKGIFYSASTKDWKIYDLNRMEPLSFFLFGLLTAGETGNGQSQLIFSISFIQLSLVSLFSELVIRQFLQLCLMNNLVLSSGKLCSSTCFFMISSTIFSQDLCCSVIFTNSILLLRLTAFISCFYFAGELSEREGVSGLE